MRVLITGGLGFIGVNTALRFIDRGDDVLVLDNVHKKGSIENIPLLRDKGVYIHIADVADYHRSENIIVDFNPDVMFHLAAQTAVTKSVEDFEEDFASNTIGSFNILRCAMLVESCRLIYASTNKVYGSLESSKLPENGYAENTPLDFHSPYGCSKGAADQYIHDFSRIYGLDTVVLRQSCIYGEHQNGTEDQGWVAHFVKQFLKDEQVTIYGDGNQIRDILYISDLVDLYEKIADCREKLGDVYNVGGGVRNAISLLGLVDKYEARDLISFSEKRPGDQQVFISDNTKAETKFDWSPSINIDSGLQKLTDYLMRKEHHDG